MADRPTASTVTARQLRREQVAVLLSRAARGVLTPNEGPLLRAAVETELADANTAYLELDNQRELFDIAYEQQAADLERARDVAVALENENARLENELRTARDGTADREALLTEARDALETADAGGHSDDWPHLAPGIRALHARAERAEQQLAQHTALLTEYVRLADITHKYGAMGGHDCLGANLACAGCDLRDRARTALEGAPQPAPAVCPGHADCERCDVIDPCPCCGLRYINGQYVQPGPDGEAGDR